MTFAPIQRFSLIFLTLLPGLAAADCATSRAELSKRFSEAPIAELADAARNLTAEGCSEAEASVALRQVSSLAARRADARLNAGDPAGAEALLDHAPVLHWEILAMRGALATGQSDHAAAARFYNQALDTLGAPEITPQDPALEPVVPRLMALAQESMMLADSAQSAMRSDGSSSGVMRAVSVGLSARDTASTGAGTEQSRDVRNETLSYNIVASAASKIDRVYLPVRFDFGSDTLSEAGRREAQALAAFLNKQSGLKSLTLIGHTDEVGGEEYNLYLSQRRTEAVRDYLYSLGVNAEIRIEWRGEFDPPKLVDASAYSIDERRAIARRVEVSFADQ
ncbi:OmpA family protein [Maliponia aquimaris]|nr:OmpA family protein [Maliponia aquimaris]